MQNPYYLINELLENIPNDRTRDVVARRFGLKEGRRHTLEAIGKNYGITRERVRQIEENGLAHLKTPKVKEKIQPIFKAVKEHLAEHGEFKREDRLYDDLAYVCYPVKEIERMKEAKNFSDLSRCQSAFYLILTLGDDFNRLPENDNFYSTWNVNKDSFKTAKKTIDSLVRHLNVKKEVLGKNELLSAARAIFPELSDKAIYSYIDASKHIEQNSLGSYGLANWPEINPRGVKDKAFIILKNEGKPLHFSEVTDRINKVLSSKRQAYVQTVHNELIKDKRFVLVGRGLYALAQWGYEPGTVSETITRTLKAEGPLNKEELINKILQKRLVKENTILINLQNRKLFVRDEEGKYAVKN